MKCQALFSLKNTIYKEKIQNYCRLLQLRQDFKSKESNTVPKLLP